jgi:hypothetical protein
MARPAGFLGILFLLAEMAATPTVRQKRSNHADTSSNALAIASIERDVKPLQLC